MEYMDEIIELQPDEKIKETSLAILYDFGGLEVWLPKSQITELDNGWCVECPLWLAVDKGLEGYII